MKIIMIQIKNDKKIMRKISISIKMVTKNGKIYDDENNENVKEVADDQPS